MTTPEHAPGHPVGLSVGPHGAWMRWCKRDDCDWTERRLTPAPTTPPTDKDEA